jgi:heme-degrading monooxygenase HmoA
MRVLELARFKVDRDAEADFLATRPAMVKAVRERLPGLTEISLVRLDDDTWVDVVSWASRADAERGPQLAAALPEVQEWMRHISADVSMDVGEIIDRAGSPHAP